MRLPGTGDILPPSHSQGLTMTTHPRQRLALLAACLLTSLLADAAVSATRQPITHEALWMMKRVGAPTVSPDGKWVVVAVLEPAYEPDKEVSDLWLLAADGSTPARRLTYTRAPEHSVSWSPDSHAI